MQLFSKTGLIRIVLISTVLISLFFLIPTVSENVDLNRILQSKTRNFIFLTLLIVFFHFFLEPLRWYIYLDDASSDSPSCGIGLPTVFSVLSMTALLSYTMPFKLGLPTRIYLMKEYFQLRVKRIVYFLAVDGFTNIAIWGSFGAISLAYLVPASVIVNHYNYVVAGIVIIAIAAYFGRHMVNKYTDLLLSGEYRITARTVALSTSLVTVDVISFGLRHMAVFVFLGLPTTYLDGFLIGILSVFAGIASTLPMGLGAYDATLILLLAQHGIPLEQASLAPILNRTLNLLTSMVLGGLSSVYLLRSTPNSRADNQ